jgi:hypothetical protein
MQETPEPKVGVWLNAQYCVNNIIAPTVPLVPLELEEFRAHLKPRQRPEFDRAIRTLAFDERTLDKMDSRYKAFIKMEFSKTMREAEGGKPRLIQTPKEARVKIEVGVWTIPASKHMARVWNANNRICYVSGMDCLTIGKIFSDFAPFACIECDGTTWDASVSVGARKCFRHYMTSCGAPPDVIKFLENCDKFTTTTRHGLEFKWLADTKSGDPDTSVSNSLYNGVVNYTYFNTLPGLWQILILGDDMLAMLDKQAFEAYECVEHARVYVDHGFIPKIRISKEPTDCTFLSRRFWPVFVDDSPSFVLGPMLGRSLRKLGYSPNSHVPKGWLKSVLASQWPGWIGSSIHQEIFNCCDGTIDLSNLDLCDYYQIENPLDMMVSRRIRPREVDIVFASWYAMDGESMLRRWQLDKDSFIEYCESMEDFDEDTFTMNDLLFNTQPAREVHTSEGFEHSDDEDDSPGYDETKEEIVILESKEEDGLEDF